ncbi:hypothetical protein VTO42DRAFT_6432 [Malbranchea cinnamomea]
MGSPFLDFSQTAEADSLAILHLRRNLLLPTILKSNDEENEGYKEGKVTNTRYGSFPHSTLIGKPWGSQVIASKVDTGSRGRRKKQEQQNSNNLKRKADELEVADANEEGKPVQKEAVAATSGFIHLLRPTPEAWTSSLPHRTQVVYTPDYSYILHRLRVRPGSTIIEAGAGSGSFTHASARAVFNGYPSDKTETKKRRLGKVCSFEFHEQRVEKIREEVRTHGLEGIVHVNHRDVYNEGFLLGDPKTGESPRANAVFLDLPAPWLALKHLVREPADGSISPLDPSSPVHICTFSPCLEQAEQTIRTLRQHSWLSISMVEVAHRQIEVRREKYGVEGEGRGLPEPKNVEEAIMRLRVFEERTRALRESQGLKKQGDTDEAKDNDVNMTEAMDANSALSQSKPSVPVFKQGNLVHRTENELKTHTSYLVFAVLPRTWSDEDEQRCREKWPSRGRLGNPQGERNKSKKQLKKETKGGKKHQEEAEDKSGKSEKVVDEQ